MQNQGYGLISEQREELKQLINNKLDIVSGFQETEQQEKLYQIMNLVPKLLNYYKECPPTYFDFFIVGYLHGKSNQNICKILDILFELNKEIWAQKINLQNKIQLLFESINNEQQQQTKEQNQKEIFQQQNKNFRKSVEEYKEDKIIEGVIQLQDQLKNEQQYIQEDLELVRKLEKEEKMNQRIIEQIQREQEREIQISIQESSKCNICKNTFLYGSTCKFEPCGHLFHEECLRAYVENCVQKQIYPIKCPSQLQCDAPLSLTQLSMSFKIQDIDIYLNKVPYNFCEKYSENKQYCCPTPYCQRKFYFSKSLLKYFYCYECKVRYCLNCKSHLKMQEKCQKCTQKY